MKTLAIVIDIYANSSIPNKSTRLLAKKPFILYSIETALNCSNIDEVLVCTVSEEVKNLIEDFASRVVLVPAQCVKENFLKSEYLDGVINDIEVVIGDKFDTLVFIDPHTPLLKTDTLKSAMNYYDEAGCEIMVGKSEKLYEDSINIERGLENFANDGNSPNYLFSICHRNSLIKKGYERSEIGTFLVNGEENTFVLNPSTWVMADMLLKKKRIMFRVDGFTALGLGHIYNCITLAYAFMEHDILLVLGTVSVEGIKKVHESGLKYSVINAEDELDELIEDFKPDIFVYDKLNSSSSYIRHIKNMVSRVITIEDLGEGTRYSDAVINALYTDYDISGYNIYNGWKYVCLREEFQVTKPNKFSDNVNNVMIMFGGTDPSNYNEILYETVKDLSDTYPSIVFNFVVGLGYDLEASCLETLEDHNIFVYPNVQRVTKYMKMADIAVTSQGRSIFEFAAMGIPSIVLPQNARERTHSFAGMDHGFINLGFDDKIEKETIKNTLEWLIHTKSVRRNMYDLMQSYSLRDGLDRVKRIILGEV